MDVIYEFGLTSQPVPIMYSAYLDGFADGNQVAVKLLLYLGLLTKFVQNNMYHSCVTAIKLFLQMFPNSMWCNHSVALT